MLNASLQNNDFICLVLKYELFRAEVNNKTFVQPCWLPLYTFDVPVTESPTAVAVQNYTQLDDHNQLSH